MRRLNRGLHSNTNLVSGKLQKAQMQSRPRNYIHLSIRKDWESVLLPLMFLLPSLRRGQIKLVGQLELKLLISRTGIYLQ